MTRNIRRHVINTFILPWLVVGAIGAAVLAGAAATRGNGNAEKDKDVPPLEIIPELVMVEPCDPDGDPNAP